MVYSVKSICSLANTSRVAMKCRAGDQQALMSSPGEPFTFSFTGLVNAKQIKTSRVANQGQRELIYLGMR